MYKNMSIVTFVGKQMLDKKLGYSFELSVVTLLVQYHLPYSF